MLVRKARHTLRIRTNYFFSTSILVTQPQQNITVTPTFLYCFVFVLVNYAVALKLRRSTTLIVKFLHAMYKRTYFKRYIFLSNRLITINNLQPTSQQG